MHFTSNSNNQGVLLTALVPQVSFSGSPVYSQLNCDAWQIGIMALSQLTTREQECDQTFF